MMQQLGGNIIAILVWVLLVVLLISTIVGVIAIFFSLLIGKKEKPPCQHNLVVCDYKETYDDGYDINKHYYVACTKCGTTNWVEERYLRGMSALGLYKEGERYD